MTPQDRKYSKTHEWIKIEGDLAVVGITDHAQESLGDVTFVELPSTGQKVAQKAECAVIESVKAASDIFSPVSGVVSKVNEDLESSPENINTDPYDKGWIFKLRDFNKEEYETLMDAASYDKFVESEQ